MGSVIMPGLVEGQIKSIGLSQFFCQHDKITASVNVEYLVPGSLATVLLYDLERNIQQTDRGKRIGLLAVDMNPPSAVVCLRNIIY